MPIPTSADPIRDLRYIRDIKSALKAHDRCLQYLYFTVAINSGLRVGDMLQLRVHDLWTLFGKPRKEFSKRTQKTGAFVITQINPSIQEAMRFAAKVLPLYDPKALLFPVSRQTVSNWLKSWCREAGMDQGHYSAHTTRKTCAYQLWARQGKTFEALMVVSKALGHHSVTQTEDYLGISRETIAEWQGELNL